MDLEGGGGTTVDVDETKGIVLIIVVTAGVGGVWETKAVPVDLEDGGGTTVDIDGTKGIVLMIVVTIDEDMVMGGGIGIIEVEVVVITSLLPVCANVIVATEVIVTGIVDVIEAVEELGCGVKTIDGLIKKAVVGVILFVTLRKLLENP